MQALIIINDPPYGTERLYNGLRLAHALLKREGDVCVFLLGDAVSGAKTGQKTPHGFYNTERMVKRVTTKSGRRNRRLLVRSHRHGPIGGTGWLPPRD